MSFYNRRAFQSVTNLVNAFGNTQPLDVVEYGGLQTVKAVVGANSSVVALAAPGASVVYRLQTFTVFNNEGSLQGTTSGFNYASTTGTVNTIPLAGQLVDEGLTFNNATAGALGFHLSYDIVEFPTIS